MAFYDLTKQERVELVEDITTEIGDGISGGNLKNLLKYFTDEDTYIRKTAYQAIGKIYKSGANGQQEIIKVLEKLFESELHSVRQTTTNAAGEIGMVDFGNVQHFFDQGLFDPHHSVRNAVIGSVKKMGQKNPEPVLAWAVQYLHHEDKEVRREICHGIELRGRTHPQDILPLLEKLQHDQTARVRNTLVHVLGQIAYKKGCLPTVVSALKTWENEQLVADALEEIVDVHRRYADFSALTQQQAMSYIDGHFQKK